MQLTPAVIWLTGLSGSGKSTLAIELERRLSALHRPAAILDGDELRRGLCSDLGFGRADRAENVRRAAEVAALLARTGSVCITSLISPYSIDRVAARSIVARQGVVFLEVFVDAPLSTCEQRDPKGLYRLARSGALQGFTGLSDPYEAPEHPDVRVKTDENRPSECASLVLAAFLSLPPSAAAFEMKRVRWPDSH